MGFRNIRELVDTSVENGRSWISSFRKVPSQGTNAGFFADLSMAAGNPVPNYYASEPLVAATLDSNKGIYSGPNAAPGEKFLSKVVLMTAAAAGVPAKYILCDYLLYYPFVDMDSLDEQIFDNTVTLPRYTDGAGVMATIISAAPPTGSGQFTIKYTNQDGTSGKVSQNMFCNTSANIASIPIGGLGISRSYGPWIGLASGDTGIRSIESCTVTVPNGGLGTLVLLKPIADFTIREIRAPSETEFVSFKAGLPKIQDGAYLNFIGTSAGGSLATTTICGYAEFIWSD